MYIEGALKRTPYCNSALGTPLRDNSVVFDIEMLLCACAIFTFDHVRGVYPLRVDIALFKKESFEQIVSAPHDHILSLAVFNCEHRRQRVVLDVYCSYCFAHLLFVRMREEKNSLFAVIHLPVRSEERRVGKEPRS